MKIKAPSRGAGLYQGLSLTRKALSGVSPLMGGVADNGEAGRRLRLETSQQSRRPCSIAPPQRKIAHWRQAMGRLLYLPLRKGVAGLLAQPRVLGKNLPRPHAKQRRSRGAR